MKERKVSGFVVFSFILHSSFFSLVLVFSSVASAADNYKKSYSRSPYTHFVELFDGQDRPIDPAGEDPQPYSPRNTCKKCHDYERIAHGYHFSPAAETASDRPGEPWIWTHRRSGSQIPLSYRNWPGTFRPEQVGMSPFDFLAEFGSHLCGGPRPGLVEPNSTPGGAAAEQKPDRFRVSGALEVDCMLCHAADRSYSHARWSKQIQQQNFAWAATAAMGLAKIEGEAKGLAADFDPAQAPDRAIHAKYDARKFDSQRHVFFAVVRRPPNRACYACHTTRAAAAAEPIWSDDDDVHLRAGILCTDCHRNGIDHQTVRGFEGEQHAARSVTRTFSCRGCHMGDQGSGGADPGGRMGAPKPQHRGLPPLHLEKMSCTSCHSGSLPGVTAQRIQTAMAHRFGIASQTRQPEDPPGIVQPVFLRRAAGVIYPHRLVWPAYWGWLTGAAVTPASPVDAYKVLRRALRIRRDFQTELANARLTNEEKQAVLGADKDLAAAAVAETAALAAAVRRKAAHAFLEKLPKGLTALAKIAPDGAEPVYVAGGKVYRLDDSGRAAAATGQAAAQPYAWPLAHDVRPARHSLGSAGCAECHARGAPFFYSKVTALGPAPDDQPVETSAAALLDEDPLLLAAWETAFAGRDVLKLVGFAAAGVVALVLFSFLVAGVYRLISSTVAGR
ncbi:MAG: hypothetical protein BMS9Abin04_392 [Planctomycetia bacterium]|nr:MAG: hypothetical protein BMS9Abin04_392 [Planctomycetia bacterium]